ncbi:MAG: hypothetical protein ACYCSG_03120 [Thermoplasmataceae archaeon]
MDMEENYNLTLLVIVNNPVELSDLFDRARKAALDGFRIEPPMIRIDDQITGGLMISSGTPSFRFPKIVSGHDLLVFNVTHSDAKRGGFQIEVQSTNGTTLSQNLYESLHEIVQRLGYSDVHSYEIGLRFIVNSREYPSFKEIEGLQTMDSPKFASLRLLDGYKGEKNLREEFISEIKVELLTQPMKSQVSTVHRFKSFNPHKLQNIFDDLDKVLSLVR